MAENAGAESRGRHGHITLSELAHLRFVIAHLQDFFPTSNVSPRQGVSQPCMTEMPPASIPATDWTTRLVWTAALVYTTGLASALLLPNDFRAMPGTLVSVVQLVEDHVPMIRRVTAYGHPHPEKLRAMLALDWLLVPFVLLALHGCGRELARVQRSGRAQTVLHVCAALVASLCMLFALWYWPNLLFRAGAPISRPVVPDDTRRMFFRSTLGVVLNAPLWVGMAAFCLDGVLESVATGVRAATKRIASR